jgi:hypothetical protein
MTNENEKVEIPPAARTLARGRKTQNWLAIGLAASVALNVATPLYYSIQAKKTPKVVIFDTTSGTLLLSPLVDPSASKETVDIEGTWAARCVLDRTPAGLENEALLDLLFNTPSAKKAKEEFGAKKNEYQAKGLRSRVEVSEVSSQPIGPDQLKVRVSGQTVVTGTVDGELVQEVHPTVIDFHMGRNPDLGTNRRYPLVVLGYDYVQEKAATR